MKVQKFIVLLIFILLAKPIYSSGSETEKEQLSKDLKTARSYAYTDLSVAIGYAEAARQIAYNLNDSSFIFRSDLLLGSLYGLKGNYDSALEFYVEADLYKDPSIIKDVAEYDMHMGAIYWSLNENRKAMSFADKALSAYVSLKDTINIAVLLNLKGLIEIDKKNYNEATLFIDFALFLNRKVNNISGAFDNLTFM